MTALPASVPHTGAVELYSWTFDSYRGLRRLRAALREALGVSSPSVSSVFIPPSPVPRALVSSRSDVGDRIAVVATELATNALRHGSPPAVVRLMQLDRRLIIDVADHDLEAEPRFDVERPPGSGGLGLMLARSFAVDVGWYRSEDSKHVWASFSE
ncbi:ATP-binding protein [Actinoplanes sp. GCM10030250]|uniref:ATP-binding protein n=1 Tax=Actinoplanes sp. GCM10030250 TaxID=3273376 RepID=UPI00361165B1